MINIANILRDLEPGYQLYSPAFGTVYFDKVDEDTQNIHLYKDLSETCRGFYPLSKYGLILEEKEDEDSDKEVMLFPSKENRNWAYFDGRVPLPNGSIVLFRPVETYSWILGEYYKENLVYSVENVQNVYICGEPPFYVKCCDIVPVSKFNFETGEFENKYNYGSNYRNDK